MGLNLLFGRSDYDDYYIKNDCCNKNGSWYRSSTTYGRPSTTVDIRDYKIIMSEAIGIYTIVKLHYPSCTNYEGVKILVYKNVTIKELVKLEHIDPHFSDSKEFYSPIARFEPTDEGWRNAVSFCKAINN